MIGRLIQNYRVEELLGEGGMGTVYKATDTLLQRPVALKMLHPHLLRDTTFFERFRNEAVLSARLNHPNVATLYNFIRDQDDNFMVMEFVDGATLENLLRKQGPFSVEHAIRAIIQALDGLHHAHTKGILHRDIKPANLMLTRDGFVKLMDFGIARLVGSERLTRVNRVMGTLEYMAPELLDGGEPSVPSDLYAVGILLYELLSGKMPFRASTDSTLITHILSQKPIPIREHRAELPKNLEQILEKLLHKKPEKRFISAPELRQALTAVVAPGLLNWLDFQQPTRIASIKPTTVTADKPRVEPTRLADSSIRSERSEGWKKIKESVLTLEGLILMGALLLVAVIMLLGFWSSDPAPTAEDLDIPGQLLADSLQVSPSTIRDSDSPAPLNNQTAVVLDPRLVQVPPSNPTDEPATPPGQKEQVPKKKQKTEKPLDERKSPVEPKKEEEPEPKKNEPETPEKIKEEKTPETPVLPKVTSRTIAVELRNETFPVEFTESISSDQENRSGKVIWLRTLAPVVVQGTPVIVAGARVRGRIVDARKATNAQKAYLAVQFEAVEAVNGQWISIRFPEYSTKDSQRVVFEQSRRVNGLKVVRTNLVLRQ
ncbi:serine/threonine-protein kinase [Arundinibacter roseus]|uniref:non-specific serine/threonine protein kinase n=1 Tax=Arundinibacter roseus TaxID=2070510 RepID=A0A4R4KKP3_9BACT|nr:serine/threonine-protein kinase [Arundinibacter roseus]TDB68834.1 serine/threonine protein kinase [Arundinibacter roseus]